jgi:hypothetical protein
VLALALGGRTVEEWQASMSQAEYLSWVAFYRLHPFDDRHRYHRPAALIGATMGGKFQDLFEFLAPEPAPEGYSPADLATMRAFGMKPTSRD